MKILCFAWLKFKNLILTNLCLCGRLKTGDNMEEQTIKKQELLEVEYDGMQCTILTENWRTICPVTERLNNSILYVIKSNNLQLLKGKDIYCYLAYLKQFLQYGYGHVKYNLIIGEIEDNYYLEIVEKDNGKQVYFKQTAKENGVEDLLEDADTWAYHKFNELEQMNNI